jgi:hypothetical protein
MASSTMRREVTISVAEVDLFLYCLLDDAFSSLAYVTLNRGMTNE